MIHFKVDIYKIFASIPSEEKIKKKKIKTKLSLQICKRTGKSSFAC